MNRLGPSLATRWAIGILVGAFFAVPLVSTFLFTLRDPEGGLSFARWIALFDPAAAATLKRALKEIDRLGGSYVQTILAGPAA